MAALPCPVWSPCQVREPFSKAPAVQHHLEHHRRAQSDSQFSALDWDTHSRTENHSLASGLQPGHWNLSSPQACSLPWPTSRLGSENHSLEELAPTRGRDRFLPSTFHPPYSIEAALGSENHSPATVLQPGTMLVPDISHAFHLLPH